MPKPTVYLCDGSACRDAGQDHHRLLDALESSVQVERTRCQKICEGPVAGVRIEGRFEWFEALNSGKLRGDLIALASGQKMSKRLRKRRSAERSGKLRQ